MLPEDKNNPLMQLQRRQLEERIQQLKSGFQDLAQTNIRTIPEHIFVAHFLPFFSGETMENTKELLAHWYNIAGSNYSPVNVVNGNGEFIIQVPPLHDNASLKPITERNQDMSYALKLAREKSTMSPLLGLNILNNELAQRLELMWQEGQNDELVKAWVQLFQHYGKLSKEAKSPVTQQDDDDEFEF